MADPQRKYYPGPGILDTVDVGPRLSRTYFSLSRHGVPLLRIDTGVCVLHVQVAQDELVALRDMLTEVIGDMAAAEAIPVGEATDSDHAALDAIGSEA